MGNKRQRKIITRLLIGALVLFVVLVVGYFADRYTSNRSVIFRTEGDHLQIYRDKKWQDFMIKGVSFGPEKGGEVGLEEPSSKAQYTRWFKQLASMDVNLLRVNTILPPAFFQAFLEYNILTDKPIYLLQGIPLDEYNIKTYRNAYEDKLNADLFEEIRRTIDVVHGKAVVKEVKGQASDTYRLNVAPYVMGYSLGAGLDADFILNTNKKNPNVMGFDGDYLYTQNASPYEAWLASVGNFAVSYEQEKYSGPCKLVSWTNLSAAGSAEAPEDNSNNNAAPDINWDHIRITEKFNAGIFAFSMLRDKFTEYLE